MSFDEEQIRDLGERWARAQVDGDIDTLGDLLGGGFQLVGPLGFVLSKEQWLAQFRSGALRIASLDWDEVEVRTFGDTAIAVGRETQRGTFQGRPADGQFRVTQVAVRLPDRWVLVGLHLSPIAQARAAVA